MSPVGIVFTVLGGAVLLIALICFVLFWFTFGRRDAVRPTKSGKWDPKNNWTQYKDIFIAEEQWIASHITRDFTMQSRDGLALRGYLIEVPGATRTAVLFHGYHGWAQMDFAPTMRFYHDLGMNVFFVDERAMNTSEGRIITFGIRESEDLVDWLDLINRELPGQDLVLGGVSMGASTVMMALRFELPQNVRALVSDCGFTSPWEIIKNTMNDMMPFLPNCIMYPVEGICRLFGFSMKGADTTEILARTTVPVCFIHGDADTFVPTEMGIRNHAACASKKALLLAKGAPHACSGMVDGDGVRAFIKQFLDEVFE